jgi:hypothetical protein
MITAVSIPLAVTVAVMLAVRVLVLAQ